MSGVLKPLKLLSKAFEKSEKVFSVKLIALNSIYQQIETTGELKVVLNKYNKEYGVKGKHCYSSHGHSTLSDLVQAGSYCERYMPRSKQTTDPDISFTCGIDLHKIFEM